MNKNVLAVLAACAIVACLAFSGETPHVCTPATPKEISVESFTFYKDARGHILNMHYKGWIVKQFACNANSFIVIMEKY